MTAFIVFGYALIGLAILYFALKVYVSYDTEGGAIGMTPVMDGVLVPPTMALFGLALVLHPPHSGATQPPQTPLDILLYGLMWIGSIILAGVIIVWAGKMGEKRHKRRKD